MADNCMDMEAYKVWMEIPEEDRLMLLANAICPKCGVSTFAPGFNLSLSGLNDMVITGTCNQCGEEMIRLIDLDDDDDYDEYENVPDEIKECMALFIEWIEASKLSQKTKEKHIGYAGFYVMEYLNYYEPCEDISEGCRCIGMFFGDWFIRKCLWSSKTSIKEMATSIKKFYKCMLEYGRIDRDDYEEICDDIKRDMAEWLERFDQYMDPNCNMEEWLWY